ncbi:MAG: hypothetical protein Q7U92_14370 [Bradyrhizobium sp.]|uniref:hypothetical protein n=1 Tax=Bradyrhizobium sp. TaxID=376 RepID=UPI00271E547D|nr:hypothetical protein [Bradyrhizobium sp.]MDO9060190.1 hypothetical protein [Bradyrhizobium sp.]MDO9564507.1 hypothetical protein [Bradyrhizobium sp.]MDP3691957.1 hypothetical protein [Bradyrhizobium sp.]
MFRRVLIALVAAGPAALPATALAYEIKPKTPETAFSKKARPDILGISADSSAAAARTILESSFKGRGKADIQEQKFGGSGLSYTAALVFTLASGPKQTGELLTSGFSSPASANLVYFIDRNLTFAQDDQPSQAAMVKQILDKYGVPTIVGNQHLYYFYRKGSIMSVGAKYKEAAALEAVDRPLDPKTALKLNDSNGRGSCVAVVKRSLEKEKNLAALLGEAKGANCDGALSVELTPGATPDRVGKAQFTLLDFKRMISAARIDADALEAEQDERNPLPRASAPKL